MLEKQAGDRAYRFLMPHQLPNEEGRIESQNYYLANIILITDSSKKVQWMLKPGENRSLHSLKVFLYKVITKGKRIA